MEEFWNFKDSWIVVEHNWVWMLIALAIGVFVGWHSRDHART